MPTLEETLLQQRQRIAAREALAQNEALRRRDPAAQIPALTASTEDFGGGARTVLRDEAGAIRNPVVTGPLTQEGWDALNAGAPLDRVFTPRNTADGIGYADDRFLSRAERDRRVRREMERRAEADPNRQIRIAQNRQRLREWAWANANDPLTPEQRAASQRWREEAYARSGNASANRRREARLDAEIARRDAIERAALDRANALERQRLISDATLRAAQATAQGTLQAAQAQAAADRYAADQERIADIATADRTLEGTRHKADQDLAAARLGAEADRYAADQERIADIATADRTLEGTRHKADQDLAAARLGAQADVTVADRTLEGARLDAEAKRHAADQELTGSIFGATTPAYARVDAAKASAQGQRDAAEAQARGTIVAAGLRALNGEGGADPFNRAKDLISLGSRLMNGGLDERELKIADAMIDSNEDLTDKEKVRRKALLRSNNKEAGIWLMNEAAALMSQAGHPDMPLPQGGTYTPPEPTPAPTPTQDVRDQNWMAAR